MIPAEVKDKNWKVSNIAENVKDIRTMVEPFLDDPDEDSSNLHAEEGLDFDDPMYKQPPIINLV